MGKTKPKKTRSFRNCPTGFPSLTEVEHESAENVNFGTRTLPLVEKVSRLFEQLSNKYTIQV